MNPAAALEESERTSPGFLVSPRYRFGDLAVDLDSEDSEFVDRLSEIFGECAVERDNGGTVHHPLVSDARSLVWLANQNCITPHVWISRVPDLYRPDLCVFDLDPGEDRPDDLREAAIAVRNFLQDLV